MGSGNRALIRYVLLRLLQSGVQIPVRLSYLAKQVERPRVVGIGLDTRFEDGARTLEVTCVDQGLGRSTCATGTAATIGPTTPP